MGSSQTVPVENLTIGRLAAMEGRSVPGCETNLFVVRVFLGIVPLAGNLVLLADNITSAALGHRLTGCNHLGAALHAIFLRAELGLGLWCRATGSQQHSGSRDHKNIADSCNLATFGALNLYAGLVTGRAIRRLQAHRSSGRDHVVAPITHPMHTAVLLITRRRPRAYATSQNHHRPACSYGTAENANRPCAQPPPERTKSLKTKLS